MAYSELIKNFDHIREYLRDFFVYGFHTRDEFSAKSGRSYDNERRRIENYLDGWVSFRQTPTGKTLFISPEGSRVTHNPLYRAFKAKSFTSRDITLHFMILDFLSDGKSYSFQEIENVLYDRYLAHYEGLFFDESTLRKKLKEYASLGLLVMEKEGRKVTYHISKDEIRLEDCRDLLRFASEENLLGVIGSCMEDRLDEEESPLLFRNHSFMNMLDSETAAVILGAIREKRWLKIRKVNHRDGSEKLLSTIPWKVYVSLRSGRNYLLAGTSPGNLVSIRIDYIRSISAGDQAADYDELAARWKETVSPMWGVVIRRRLEHISMDIHVEPDENFIVRRLEREKRCGKVTRIDEKTFRFEADVMDSLEMVPWIRTFFGRITRLSADNPRLLRWIHQDLKEMSSLYEVNHDIQ